MKTVGYFLLVTIVSIFYSVTFVKENTLELSQTISKNNEQEKEFKEIKQEVIILLNEHKEVNEEIKQNIRQTKQNIKSNN